MKTTQLSLRVRIFLFFAVLMLAIPISIAIAIWMASQSDPAQLPRMLTTFTALAAVFLILITILIWQLFDRHVAAALQTLARQMQTALHSDTEGLQDTEPYRYLGPVGDAANDILQSYKTMSRHFQQIQNQRSDSEMRESQQLAAILRDLDVGVMAMNLRHQVLLYNHQAISILNEPGRLSLARSASSLFQGQSLASQVDVLLAKQNNNIRIPISLTTAHSMQKITGKASPVVGVNGKPTGYVLVLDHQEDKSSQTAPCIKMQAQSFLCAPDTDEDTNGDGKLDSRPEFYDFDLFDRTPTEAAGSRPLTHTDFVVFDTETTGLDPSNGDEIISIGAVRIVNGRILRTERFDQLVNPRRSVPERSIVFHGITSDMLEGKPDICKVLPEFASFAEDSILVAHNAAFDMKFIQLKETKCNIKLTNPVLDTVLLSAWLHDHVHDHTLDALAERFGLSIDNRHSALGDAMATAQIFCKMLDQLSVRGITTLSEALAVSDKMTHIKKLQEAY